MKRLLERRSYLSSWGISLVIHSVVLLALGQVWLWVKLKPKSPSTPFLIEFMAPLLEEIPSEVKESVPEESVPEEFGIPVSPQERLPEKKENTRVNEIREKLFSEWNKDIREVLQELSELRTLPVQVYQRTKSASILAHQQWSEFQTYLEIVERKARDPVKTSKRFDLPQKKFSPAPVEKTPANSKTEKKDAPFTPARIKKVLPLTYPTFAERMEYEGVVTLRIQISEMGAVFATEIYKSSGYSLLDESAKEQVYTWEFYPATRGNVPICSWIRIPIRFQIP